jgi:hypothetical protein
MIALGPPQPGQEAVVVEAPQRAHDRADPELGLVGDRRDRRLEAAAHVVDDLAQRLEHRPAGEAQGAHARPRVLGRMVEPLGRLANGPFESPGLRLGSTERAPDQMLALAAVEAVAADRLPGPPP